MYVCMYVLSLSLSLSLSFSLSFSLSHTHTHQCRTRGIQQHAIEALWREHALVHTRSCIRLFA